MKGWTPQAIEKASKPTGPPATPLTRPAHPDVADDSREAGRSQEIIFPTKVPGNNGPAGLLRLHWRLKLALQNTYTKRVWAAQLKPYAGPVRLELTRYSIGRQMDYDNLVSTGKLLIDALVRARVLPDDDQTVIAEREYKQARAAGKDTQRTVIKLIAL